MDAQCLTGRIIKALAASLGLAGLLIGFGPGAASASTCAGWTGTQPPSPGSADNELFGVAVLSSCDAWTVGYYDSGQGERSLILHWNGATWKQLASPDPGDNTDVLRGVAVVSPANIWAVGYYQNGVGVTQPLIVHWNGTAWNQVAAARPGNTDNELMAVRAISAKNIWAVGDYCCATANGAAPWTLIEHWDGRSWKHVASPNGNSNGYNFLSSVAGFSGNAWAVGQYFNSTAGESSTLILRWNGTAWKRVRSPAPGTESELRAVRFSSASNGWAVGGYVNSSHVGQTLILRWNGTAWKQVASPNPASGAGLFGLVIVSPSNAWAVGSGNGTYVVHWDGTAWRHVASPSLGSGDVLFGVAGSSATSIWAVGVYSSGTVTQTLALHCC